jgi:hypothetical protein
MDVRIVCSTMSGGESATGGGELKLRSPFGDSDGIGFSWPLSADERQEIHETVRIFRTEHKEMYFVLERKFKNGVPADWNEYVEIVNIR